MTFIRHAIFKNKTSINKKSLDKIETFKYYILNKTY